MIRAVRPSAMALDDAAMLAGWNVSPNLAYTLALIPGASACAAVLYSEHGEVVASGAALVGTAQPCVLLPHSGQTIDMVDADLGWHVLLTTTGTESPRTVRVGPAVDLPDEIHPVYGADDLAVVRATAAIDAAAHYIDDVTVTCPLGLGAGLGDVVSVPVDGAAVVGQVESITWTATPDGTPEQAIMRRHVAIASEAFVEPTLPTVADDTGTATHLAGTSGNVLTNDASGLTVTAVDGLSGNVGTAVDGNNGGSFIVNADGSWTFNPAGDFALLEGSETAETSVTYHASDGITEAMATLTVTVSHANAAPVAVDDTGATTADATTSGNVLTNDTDAEGDTLAVSQVAGSAANVGVAVAGSGGGLFTISSDGAWTFDPNSEFGSLAGSDTATTSVTYIVSDGMDEDAGTLTVTVSAAAAANIEFVGSVVGGSAGGGIITLTLPAGIQPGDVCILAGALGGASTSYSLFFTADGFTYIGGARGDDSTDVTLTIRYKVLDGSETTLTVNTGWGRPAAVVAYVLRGVNVSSPFDVTSVFASDINTGVANSPVITPVTDHSMIVIVGASAHVSTTAQTITAPSGFTNLARHCQTATSYSSATLGVASAIVQAGAIDPAAWGGLSTSTSCAWAAATIALRPA